MASAVVTKSAFKVRICIFNSLSIMDVHILRKLKIEGRFAETGATTCVAGLHARVWSQSQKGSSEQADTPSCKCCPPYQRAYLAPQFMPCLEGTRRTANSFEAHLWGLNVLIYTVR